MSIPDFPAVSAGYDPLEQPEPTPGLIGRALRAYLEGRALRSAVRDLQGMDDHILADIGMARGEIHSVVYGKGADQSRRSWE